MIEEDSPGKVCDARLTARLGGYLKPYRSWIAVSVVLLIIHSIFAAAGPYLTKVVIDRYLEPTAESSSPIDHWLPQDAASGLDTAALIYLVILCGGFLARHGQIILMQRAGQKAMRDLRVEIFSHLHRMGVAFFDRNAVGRLAARATTDVDTLNEMYASGVVAVFGDLLTLVFVLAAMLHLSPELTLVCCAVMPLAAAVSIWFRKRFRESFREARAAGAKINAFLQELFSGIEARQLFLQEPSSAREFDTVNDKHRAAHYRTIRAHAYFYPIMEWLSVLAVAVVLVYGGWRIAGGDLTIGIVVAFILYGGRVFRTMQDLSGKYNILQAAMAGAARIFQLLDTPPDQAIAEPPPTGPHAAARAVEGEGAAKAPELDVEFQNVWFAYKDEDWVLRGVNFHVRAGETVAFVGRTGAGKTTLISLLLRFYEPQEGRIFVGGREIRDWPIDQLRRSFGVVLQDPCLFAGTVGGNIRCGDQTISDERLTQAADDVNLTAMVRLLPSGFDQPPLDRGSSLSSAENQLIRLDRAWALGPRLLILDEAASSVNTDTERKIREALSRMVSGHTAIVIARRLSTIRLADRIVVLHKGKIRETGSHNSLMEKQGIYWRLYRLQFHDQQNNAGRGQSGGSPPLPGSKRGDPS